MKNTEALKNKSNKILFLLRKEYPDTKCSLQFDSPFQLLVATILSAQCTDKRVNVVTKNLFSKFPEVIDYKNINPVVLEKILFSTGFYRNKSKAILKFKNILECMNLLCIVG